LFVLTEKLGKLIFRASPVLEIYTMQELEGGLKLKLAKTIHFLWTSTAVDLKARHKPKRSTSSN
jgi:hypothetical protein